MNKIGGVAVLRIKELTKFIRNSALILFLATSSLALAFGTCGQALPIYGNGWFVTDREEADISKYKGNIKSMTVQARWCSGSSCSGDGEIKSQKRYEFDRSQRLEMSHEEAGTSTNLIPMRRTRFLYKGEEKFPLAEETVERYSEGEEKTEFIRGEYDIPIRTIRKRNGKLDELRSIETKVEKLDGAIRLVFVGSRASATQTYRDGRLIAYTSLSFNLADPTKTWPLSVRCVFKPLENGYTRIEKLVTEQDVVDRVTEIRIEDPNGRLQTSWFISLDKEKAREGMGRIRRYGEDVSLAVDAKGNPTHTQNCDLDKNWQPTTDCEEKKRVFQYWD